MHRLLAATCVAGFVCVSTAAFAAPAPVITPVFSGDTTIIGQKIEVPKDPSVVVTIVSFAPGARTAVHKHVYPHYGYMLEGTLTIMNTKTGKSFDLKPGEFLVEMQDTYHYGENRGKVPVRILVIDQLPKGIKTNSVAQETPTGH